MAVIINGDTGISPVTASGTSALVDGMTVGRGAGEVSTNTVVGASALAGSVTGGDNSAFGREALNANTSGYANAAFGRYALAVNTTGIYNTAVGGGQYNNTYGPLTYNTTGSYNTAVGGGALVSNTTASNNTAVGYQSLQANTTASNNTAVGYQAGYTNSTGAANTFVGRQAGYSATGTANTFVGQTAGYFSTGSYNTFVGTGSTNAAGDAVTSGSRNTIIGGYGGNQGGLDIRTASNYIVLSDGDGNPRAWYSQGGAWAYIGSGAGTNAVRYNTTTKEWTYDTSSAKYKDNIRDSVYGLSHVMQMRSTQFEYKDTGRSDIGLIAEELDLIVPELVGKNDVGEPDSVSYDRMVSVLVKAIQEQQAIITQLQADVAALKGA